MCAAVCGNRITEINVNSINISLFGKNRNALKIECVDRNTKELILNQARVRKPVGIYVVEFLPSNKLQIQYRLLELKQQHPTKLKAIYSRRGDIFARIDPDDHVMKFNSLEDVKKLAEDLIAADTTPDGDGDEQH